MKAKNYFIGLTLALVTKVAMAGYDYPLGVPEAWISPDIPSPELPTAWDEDIPGFYYLNPDNPECVNGVNGEYGNHTVPLCRFPTTFPAGSVVKVDGSNYTYTSQIYIYGDGTEAKPVWILGTEGKTFPMAITFSGTYTYIDGLHLVNNKGINVRTYKDRTTNHIMFRNGSIIGTGSFGGGTAFSSKGSVNETAHNIIAYNNEIAYNGQWDAETSNDSHALQVGSYINHVWYLNNYTHHNGGDGVQFSHGGKEANHFYYAGNHSHHERENCVDIKVANDVVISSNLCHDITPVDTANGSCMVVHYDPSRIWFINNEIYNCTHGITSTGAFDLYIVGNDIYNIVEDPTEYHDKYSSYQTGAGVKVYSTGNLVVANNTIDNVVRGVGFAATDKGYNVEITGNIVTNTKNGQYTGNPAIAYLVTGASVGIRDATFENNLMYAPARIYYGGLYEGLADLQENVSTACTLGGCLDIDPQYKDYPVDRSLKSTAPGVDKGYVSSAYADYSTLYGENIEADINYVTRYLTPDMGSYESNQNVLPRFPTSAYDVFVNVNTGELSWSSKTLDATSHTVYKNGVVLADDISGTSSTYSVPNISDSKDEYVVGTENSKGFIMSDPIYSDDLHYTRVLDVDEQLQSNKSWAIFRQGKFSTVGDVDIGFPEYSSAAYGSSYGRTAFRQGDSTFKGYVYLKAVKGSYIEGNVSGSGEATMYFVDSNYSNKVSQSELTVNDSKIFIDTDKGFNQTAVTIGLDGSDNSYIYEAVTEEEKALIGISAIVEE